MVMGRFYAEAPLGATRIGEKADAEIAESNREGRREEKCFYGKGK
jgi:hypothetical protein